jgi:undecaprenyl-phosphate 4-deoxy-4-formamido-L-arabinose transferase
MSMPPTSRISVVIPVYNEDPNLEELVSRLLAVLDGLDRPAEVILVDDGSRDRSVEILKGLAADHPARIRVIELSHNYGQHQAILAGFTFATGDVVITLDADLQNPPEEIPKLVALTDEGHDVVGGVRRSRQDPLVRRLASRVVNRVTVAMTGIRLSDYGCMLRAYSREVVELINRCEEKSTFIPALAQTFARRPAEVEVRHAERPRGASKYSLYRLVRLNFDLMTGFSVVPLQLFTLFGFAVAVGGVAFGVYLLVRRFILLGHSEADGLFTLFALAFVVMGVAMAGVGIVGEYIGRVYQEVRGRPRYLVRHTYGEAGAPVRFEGQRAGRPREGEVSDAPLVVFGYADVGHACLSLLLERGANVVALYTHHDPPGERLWFPSVARLAEEHGIPVRYDVDLRESRELAALRALAPDLLLSFYYRHLIPRAALELPRMGAFNMHGSLLPKYRGRAPVNWAVLHGETETGATLHVMTERADAGEIVDQERVPIGPTDTAADVQTRVRDAAVAILARRLDELLHGTAPRRGQDESAATTFGRRRPEDGAFEWSADAADIHNLVRALTHPYPGAFTHLAGRKLYVWETRLSRREPRRVKVGELQLHDGVSHVVCGDGRLLELHRGQFAGEKELEGTALAQALASAISPRAVGA